MGIKKALVVGINYVGTGNDLRGCINDANNMAALLKGRGFDVELMLEKDATTAGIKAGLKRLTTGVSPGDVIVFHYSGHGSQLPSKTEADGFEEIICPIDLNWTTRVISDKDLKAVFDPVPNGVNTTLILDCCHSGTGLNQNETLQDTRDLVAPSEVESESDSRYLAPPAKILAKLQDRELVNWETSRDVNASALLIAGCRADQTSADAYINGVYQGAATASILEALSKNPMTSYRTLTYSMTDYMIKNRYTQRPQLDGFSGLYDEIFGEPFGSTDFEPAPGADEVVPGIADVPTIPVPAIEMPVHSPAQVVPGTTLESDSANEVPVDLPVQSEKKDYTPIIVGLLIVAAVILFSMM